MHHDLKLLTDYYQRKKLGLKPWELRSITDRDFQPGDTVTFHEVNRDQIFTGYSLGPFKITYVLSGSSPGLQPNHVIFTHTTEVTR